MQIWRKSATLVLASAALLLSLASAGLAQSFTPTGEEKQLCFLLHAMNDADKAKHDLMQSGNWTGAQMARASDEAARTALEYDSYYQTHFMSLQQWPQPRRDAFWVWCMNIDPATIRKYDLAGAMGARTDLEPITITLYMPEERDYARRELVVFHGNDPPFKRAAIGGYAYWETLFYRGDATNQTIKAVVWKAGKAVHHVVGKTDGTGHFTLDLAVNDAGTEGTRAFRVNITRGITHGYAPADAYGSAQDATGAKLSPDELAQLPTEDDWKKVGFAKFSKLYALYKDYQWHKAGGIGSPNTEQWYRNHERGRDDVNALNMIIDIAASPATGYAQVIENSNMIYKRLTGKPLPFVKANSAAEKAAYKAMIKGIWDRIDATKQAIGDVQ